MREDGDASDKPLDIAVLSRMKQFRAMNKLKKVALKVRVLYSVLLFLTRWSISLPFMCFPTTVLYLPFP